MTCLGSFRCIYENKPNVKIPSYLCLLLHKYFQNRNMFSLIFTRIFPTTLYFKELRATYFPDSNNTRFKKYPDTCGRAGS